MDTLGNRLSVVVLTHNRAYELQRTLQHLCALPEQPSIVVVDNASIDDTLKVVKQDFPQVKLVQLKTNLGAAARNVGVYHVGTPYVAFCDDDTWWAPGALRQAADLLDAYPTLAVLSARILVGEAQIQDPACTIMQHSPLPSDRLPGRAVLGFLAGAAVFRRSAFLDAGGYEPHFFIGGEEALLALDLAVRDWTLLYAPQLVVHHYPSAQRDTGLRRKLLMRNAIWVAWMRLPWKFALKQTLDMLRTAYRWHILAATALNALRGLPWALENRRVIPLAVEAMYRQIQHWKSRRLEDA